MSLSSRIWKFAGSIHVTVVVCLMLFVDMTIGYVCLDRRTTLFQPLNDVGLPVWAQTYGWHNLTYTAWFFLMLGLLAVLGLNAFVCTTDRMITLVKSRSHYSSRKRFYLKLAPHMMHYATIVILTGYLASYLLAEVYPSKTLVPGSSIAIPGTGTNIMFRSSEPRIFQDHPLAAFENRVFDPGVSLALIDGVSSRIARIAYNKPVRWQGYLILLKNFYPKRKGGLPTRPSIELTIRRDPGVSWYFAGMAVFILGLGMYVYQWLALKQQKGVDS